MRKLQAGVDCGLQQSKKAFKRGDIIGHAAVVDVQQRIIESMFPA